MFSIFFVYFSSAMNNFSSIFIRYICNFHLCLYFMSYLVYFIHSRSPSQKKKKKKRDYTRLNASVKFRYVKKCILQLFS